MTRPRLPWARVAVAAVLLSACQQVPECVNTSHCGELEACIEGQCEAVECLSSTNCDVHTRCDRTTYTCESGCDFDGDCFSDEWCNLTSNTCEVRECRNSVLDCTFGERCDAQTGDCYDDPEPHCEPCSGDASCGTDGRCFRFTSGSSGANFCLLGCNPEEKEPCPAGYQCSMLSEEWTCIAWCPTGRAY